MDKPHYFDPLDCAFRLDVEMRDYRPLERRPPKPAFEQKKLFDRNGHPIPARAVPVDRTGKSFVKGIWMVGLSFGKGESYRKAISAEARNVVPPLCLVPYAGAAALIAREETQWDAGTRQLTFERTITPSLRAGRVFCVMPSPIYTDGGSGGVGLPVHVEGRW